MTKQRALLLSIFRSELCKGQHKTADELLVLAREKMPGISRATVYNNLRGMEEEGLIRRITAEDGADFYDSSFVLHGHLICTVCRRISDIEVPTLLDDLKKISGADVESYELKLRYVCNECKAENRAV